MIRKIDTDDLLGLDDDFEQWPFIAPTIAPTIHTPAKIRPPLTDKELGEAILYNWEHVLEGGNGDWNQFSNTKGRH